MAGYNGSDVMERNEISEAPEAFRMEELSQALEEGTDKLECNLRLFENMNPKDVQSHLECYEKLTDDEKQLYNEIVEREPAITQEVQDTVRENGGQMEGLEYRLKLPESVHEKIYLRGEESIELSEMRDVIRYTGELPSQELAKGANKTLDSLEQKGYSVEKVKNTWLDENASYKGINIQLTEPKGQTFELQFHTKESFEVKQQNHEMYNESRILSEDHPRRIELEDKMAENTAKLKTPPNIDEVKNK